MKKMILTALAGFSACHIATAQFSKFESFAKEVNAKMLHQHLSVLAHDSFMGRGTGEEGADKASAYIAKYFKEYGLKPVKDKNGKESYFQEVALCKTKLNSVELSINNRKLEYLKDFYVSPTYFKTKVENDKESDLVFAGFGIEDDLYDDYKNLEVANRSIIILDGEPKLDSATYLISKSSKPSRWTNERSLKINRAREKGAKHIIIIRNDDFKRILNYMGHYLESPPIALNVGEMSNKAVVNISTATAATIWGITEKQVRDLWTQLAKPGTDKRGIGLKMATAKVNASASVEPVAARNVWGIIEGKNKQECVAVTAHYDHLGMEGGVPNNGADDDGSGTATLITLAKALGEASKKGAMPERNIMLLAVTGEEKGLLGSDYYSRYPAYDLEKTTADINIDMIGRIDNLHERADSNYVYVIGADKISTELHEANESVNKKYTNIKLDYKFNDENDPNRFYYRSDHYNFAKKGVPVIFFFSGVHDDYHKPTDDIEKIMWGKYAKTAQLSYYLTVEAATRKGLYKRDKWKPEDKSKGF